jgi:hypothetical protein
MDVTDDGFSSIQLEFNNNHFIEYVLGFTDGTSLTNSSNTCYVMDIENQNQTGTWYNLFRNIEEDVFQCYGELDWNLTSVRLKSYTTGTTTISTIFDDLYFVEDIAGPIISNNVQTPMTPQYFDPVTIEVDVEDNTAVTTVELYYKIGSAPWTSKLMTYVGGIHYETSLSSQGYSTIVHYYFESEDMHGLESSLGSEGTPFEYSVVDLVAPILTVESPSTNESLVGTVVFNISGSDVGSDIASFTISVDSEIIIDENEVPATFSWATTNHENGQHIIAFTLEDNAGNNETIQLEYTINNPIPWYIKTRDFFVQYWPYLTAGGGALVVGIIAAVIAVRIRRRKKVA